MTKQRCDCTAEAVDDFEMGLTVMRRRSSDLEAVSVHLPPDDAWDSTCRSARITAVVSALAEAGMPVESSADEASISDDIETSGPGDTVTVFLREDW